MTRFQCLSENECASLLCQIDLNARKRVISTKKTIIYGQNRDSKSGSLTQFLVFFSQRRQHLHPTAYVE